MSVLTEFISCISTIGTKSFQTQRLCTDCSFPSQCHTASVNPDWWSFWWLSPLMSRQNVMKEPDRKWSGDSQRGFSLFRHWIKSFDQLFSICDVHLVHSVESIGISLSDVSSGSSNIFWLSKKVNIVPQWLLWDPENMGQHKVSNLPATTHKRWC